MRERKSSKGHTYFLFFYEFFFPPPPPGFSNLYHFIHWFWQHNIHSKWVWPLRRRLLSFVPVVLASPFVARQLCLMPVPTAPTLAPLVPPLQEHTIANPNGVSSSSSLLQKASITGESVTSTRTSSLPPSLPSSSSCMDLSSSSISNSLSLSLRSPHSRQVL